METAADILAKIEGQIAEMRELLTDLQGTQGESSDEANEQKIMGALAGLDHLEGEIGDIVA